MLVGANGQKIYGSWVSVWVKAVVEFFMSLINHDSPVITGPPPGSAEVCRLLRNKLDEWCAAAGLFGSQLSVALDWFIERFRALLTNVDWTYAEAAVELEAINYVIDNILPVIKAKSPTLKYGIELLLEPFLEQEKKRCEAILNPQPAPTP